MIKVAIITRTKDRIQFLKRALNSIAGQSYTDYVHVIVNDGGNNADIDKLIKNLSKEQQSKTKVFHREVSSGAPDTIFNESIDRIDSEYFVIHDDDDTWNERFLEETVKVLDNNQQLAGVVVRTDKVIERVTSNSIKTVKTTPYMPDMKAISLYRQCLDNQLTPISTLFRRSAYIEVGKFNNELPVVGDWEFGVRLLQKYDVEYIDSDVALAYYHHRDNGDNSFTVHNHRKYITKVMNQYLRDDLKRGNLGIGYIMNSLRYEQDMIASTVRKVLPKSIAKLVRKKVR